MLEKIFGKKEPERLLKLELQKLDAWIAEKKEEEMSKLRASAKEDIEKILELRDSAIEIVDEISGSEFSEELKSRVYKPVLTSKPLYVKGITEALRGIRAVDDTKQFHADLLRQLKKIQNVQINQGRHLANVFEEDFRRLGTILNGMTDAANGIGEKVDAAERGISRLNGLASSYSELNSLTREKEKMKKEQIAKNIEKIRHDLERLDQKIAAVEESREFKHFLALKARAEENAKRRDALQSYVLNMLGPLSRVFRKHAKTVDKEAKNVLNAYIEKPAVTFFSDMDGRGLAEVLNEIRGSIGSLGFEKAEEEKNAKRIEDAVNAVPDLALAAKKVEEDGEKIKKELESLKAADELESLMKSRKFMAEEMAALEKKMLSDSERTAELEKIIRESKEKLEEKISEIAGRKITLQ